MRHGRHEGGQCVTAQSQALFREIEHRKDQVERQIRTDQIRRWTDRGSKLVLSEKDSL